MITMHPAPADTQCPCGQPARYRHDLHRDGRHVAWALSCDNERCASEAIAIANDLADLSTGTAQVPG